MVLLIHFQVGPHHVEIVHADITSETTHAIAVPANRFYVSAPMEGGVQAAVARAGGGEIFTEVEAHVRGLLAADETLRTRGFPVGHTIVTGGGRLPAQSVIHVRSIAYIQGGGFVDKSVVRDAVSGVLRAANDRKFESVSVPAFGANLFRVPIADTVHGAVAAIRKHAKTPSTIKRIRLVYLEKRDYEAAVKAAAKYAKPAT